MARARDHIVVAASIVPASAMLMLAPLLNHGDTPEAWLLAARHTARLSFCVFLAVFLAEIGRPALRLRHRYDFTISFVTAHAIHLIALGVYVIRFQNYPGLAGPILGGIAYGLIAALAITIVLGRTPSWLRGVSLHYILAIFTLTYASRLTSSDARTLGLVGVAAGGAALAIRHAKPLHRYLGLEGGARLSGDSAVR